MRKVDPLKIQVQLEAKIKRLLENGAPIEELQKAYDELHSHLLKYGIRGRLPQGYLYKGNLSLIDVLFLKIIGSGKSVLEIGVGDGHFLIACAKKGNIVKGLDISKVAISRLSYKLRMEGINAELKLGDARSLDFPEGTFDFVVSKDLIEHLPSKDLQIHLRDVWRVLKPDGFYLMWTPSKLLGSTSLGTHLKEYTLREILHEFANAGFNPQPINLHAYIFLRWVKIISPNIVRWLVKYEHILEKVLQKFRIRAQHVLLYFIIPPVCIIASKRT